MRAVQLLIRVVVLTLCATIASSNDSVSVVTGTIASDRLGGVGGHKSIAGVEYEHSSDRFGVRLLSWSVAEGLDDDQNISPQRGSTLHAIYKTTGGARVGVLHAGTDMEDFSYLSIGIGDDNRSIDLLAPLSEGRFGIAAGMRVSISRRWFAQARYEYVGREDPDVKLVLTQLQIGRSFR